LTISVVMEESEQQDTFGTGLRAYLGRHAAEEVPAEEPASDAAAESQATPGEPPRPLTPEEELALRSEELAERERQLREHIQAFEAHLSTLARREEALREREAAAEAQAQATAERRPVREALREHAEMSIARVLQVFDDALAADHPAGGADHGVRLAAVRALLAEAYASDGDPGTTAAVIDELAELRHRRTAT
jgi:hypothetical protein